MKSNDKEFKLSNGSTLKFLDSNKDKLVSLGISQKLRDHLVSAQESQTYTLTFASEANYIGKSIEIRSIDDLKALQKKYNNELVIDFNLLTIVVVDDYL